MGKIKKEGLACPSFLVHPTKGFEDRGEFMRKQFDLRGISCTPVEAYDAGSGSLAEATPKWFTGKMLQVSDGVRSCTAKHIEACRLVVDRGVPGAIIFEDDAKLADNFCDIVNRSLAELAASDYCDKPVLISYENSRLRFVERSRRQKGRLLYPSDKSRMTAAYYINREACRRILEYAGKNKFSEPIDITHELMARAGEIVYLWCQPTVVTQGSFDGTFQTSLSAKAKQQWLRWQFKLAYRKLLYYLR